MMMVLYFSIMGGLFYKLFITAPYEQKNAIKSETRITSIGNYLKSVYS